MVDKISLKIMKELCHDGRSSNVQLARRLGLSIQTVAKKVNAMVENGTIVIKAMPNPAIMGYQAQACIGLFVDLKKLDVVFNQLKNNIHVNMVTTCFGKFDILIFVFFSDFLMLQDYIKEELLQIEGINHIETYLISEEKKRNKGIFPQITESKPVLIDEIDQKIIEELIRNGRPKHSDLAGKLGISKPTLSRRINLLLKESVIKILALPNPSRIGYSANAYIFINAELTKIDEICDQLSSYPEVHLVMRLLNNYDILVGIYSVNPDTLYEFLKSKVGNIDGIIHTETFIRGNSYYFSADAVFPPSA